MIWSELLPLLKGVGIVAFVLWFAKLLKDSGRKDEKIKHVEGKIKKLTHQQQYQVLEIKRSEQQAKKAREYSKRVEEVLSKYDPSSLTKLQLDELSHEPLSFTDIQTSERESSISTEDENDK